MSAGCLRAMYICSLLCGYGRNSTSVTVSCIDVNHACCETHSIGDTQFKRVRADGRESGCASTVYA